MAQPVVAIDGLSHALKTCPDCLRSKSVDDFHRSADRHDGRQVYCKSCKRLRRLGNSENERLNGYKRHLERKYGISFSEFQALLDGQGGECAICRREFAGQIDVDHNHVTGQVRGLLCHPCNLALGFLRDDPVTVERALTYLKERN